MQSGDIAAGGAVQPSITGPMIVTGLIILVAFQALLIGTLLVERHRSRRNAATWALAQCELDKSDGQFHNMADATPIMIWVAGPDKLGTFFNKQWLTFTGHGLEQELGNGWLESLHPDDRDRVSRTYSTLLDAHMPFQIEYRLRRADGEYRSLLCTGLPGFQPSGEFSGYIGSCVDVTDLKSIQEKSLVGQKLETMGLLAGGIAHDFSNLMGGILASSELALMQHTDGTPHQEELLRIKAAATAGAEIVRELMGDRESPVPPMEPIDCSLLVREMLQILEVSIAKHITLKTELSQDLSTLEGNASQIRQLIMNLVINAADAIGDQPGEIRVTTKMVRPPAPGAADLRDGAYVQLEVADTGGGISDEAKGRIFDPFFTTKSAGRGLGLTVVQRVVRSHGGIVNVHSTPGLGSTFQILLPSGSGKEQRPEGAAALEVAEESKDEHPRTSATARHLYASAYDKAGAPASRVRWAISPLCNSEEPFR